MDMLGIFAGGGLLFFFFFLDEKEWLCLIPSLVVGTTIPFGKSPYNPWAIAGHILQLSNSKFETFQVLQVLPAGKVEPL